MPAPAMPSRSAPPAAPGAAAPGMGDPMAAAAPPTAMPTATPPTDNPNPVDPVQAAMANVQALPEVRPEIEPRVSQRVEAWWTATDNQPQRTRAIAEVKDAHKHLFPARFDPLDAASQGIEMDKRTGKDDRRVNVPMLFRDGLQMTAMTVPDDTKLVWSPAKQVKAPIDPMVGQMAAQAVLQGVPGQMAPAAVGAPAQSANPDQNTERFAESLGVVQENLLIEADWILKIQAWVQDAEYFPLGVIKFYFRRDYHSAPVSEAPLNKDEQDNLAMLESLVQRYAQKLFDEKHADYHRMLQLMAGLKAKAEVSRWYGVEMAIIPMDAFGVAEAGTDIVDIYNAPYMWHDALVVGEDLLAKYKYTVLPDGSTTGILPSELATAMVAQTPDSANGRQKKTRNNTKGAASGGPKMDPLRFEFAVREIHCKADRTVYTVIKGLKHFVSMHIPQKKSDRWYPFAIVGGNRVPGEAYAASNLELKKDIQKRINRKRTDEEKSRWLALPRGVANLGLADESEIIKMGDIPPGQIKGVNLGASKIADVLVWTSYIHNPECFNTEQDEMDKDKLGALPAQTMGATGIANSATEVNVAAHGSTVALQFRQGNVRKQVEGFLVATGQEILQELSPEEARMIGGPHTYWPEIYGEREAKQIVDTMREQTKAEVIPAILPELVAAFQSGVPIDKTEIATKVDQLVAPLLAQKMQARFGAPEPITRESIFRRLKVQVESVTLSALDLQTRIQSLSLLAEATNNMSAAAQASGTPFVPREMLMLGAKLLSGETSIDRMFPPAPQQGMMPAQPPGGEGAPPGKDSPENQGAAGGPANKAQNTQNANTPVATP